MNVVAFQIVEPELQAKPVSQVHLNGREVGLAADWEDVYRILLDKHCLNARTMIRNGRVAAYQDDGGVFHVLVRR